MESQCRDANTGEMWSVFSDPVKNLAAAFWTSCRWDNAVWGRPIMSYNSLLDKYQNTGDTFFYSNKNSRKKIANTARAFVIGCFFIFFNSATFWPTGEYFTWFHLSLLIHFTMCISCLREQNQAKTGFSISEHYALKRHRCSGVSWLCGTFHALLQPKQTSMDKQLIFYN